MSLKKAAEDLLKVADSIEQQASEISMFVCDSCNHTASLASINSKRKVAAESSESNISVSDLSVNDKVACVACEGVMSYKASEASELFYFEKDAAKKSEDEDSSEEEDVEGKEASKEEKKEEAPKEYDEK